MAKIIPTICKAFDIPKWSISGGTEVANNDNIDYKNCLIYFKDRANMHRVIDQFVNGIKIYNCDTPYLVEIKDLLNVQESNGPLIARSVATSLDIHFKKFIDKKCASICVLENCYLSSFSPDMSSVLVAIKSKDAYDRLMNDCRTKNRWTLSVKASSQDGIYYAATIHNPEQTVSTADISSTNKSDTPSKLGSGNCDYKHSKGKRGANQIDENKLNTAPEKKSSPTKSSPSSNNKIKTPGTSKSDIPCKNGSECTFARLGSCDYKHSKEKREGKPNRRE
jgi:hypothetical protein